MSRDNGLWTIAVLVTVIGGVALLQSCTRSVAIDTKVSTEDNVSVTTLIDTKLAQSNFEVAQLKEEVARLKNYISVLQIAVAHHDMLLQEEMGQRSYNKHTERFKETLRKRMGEGTTK